MAMEPPTALGAGTDRRGEEQGLPLAAARSSRRRWCAGSTTATSTSPACTRTRRPRRSSRSRCEIDNWRWAGVPFYLRTGKRMADGGRIISIAFREPPKSMFPSGSGVGAHGPDHLTFDLADASRLSLSFYGKRPGPGMRLDKQSLQFALARDRSHEGDLLEAYERLIYDAMCGDHTLFTSADGIESVWEKSAPLLEGPPPLRPVPAWIVGARRDARPRRARCVAAALRASLAERRPRLSLADATACARRSDRAPVRPRTRRRARRRRRARARARANRRR